MTNFIATFSGAKAVDTTIAGSAKSHTSSQDQQSTIFETLKQEKNVAIMEASLSVSLQSQNEPLALLYKTAIDSLNDILKTDLGDYAIQNAMQQDNTPEGTAGRIVSLSTAFFDAYKEQHPEEDAETAVKNFMSTIRRGFEKGFQEASNILDNLQVLNGDIAVNIDKTYALVLQGYADFETGQLALLQPSNRQAENQ